MLSTFARSCFFNDSASAVIYSLSLHDALPISEGVAQTSRVIFLVRELREHRHRAFSRANSGALGARAQGKLRSEEHTSELQSRFDLVCRLLLEKKNVCRRSTCR